MSCNVTILHLLLNYITSKLTKMFTDYPQMANGINTITCLSLLDIDFCLQSSWTGYDVIAVYNDKEYRLCEDLESCSNGAHYDLMKDSNTLSVYGF